MSSVEGNGRHIKMMEGRYDIIFNKGTAFFLLLCQPSLKLLFIR